MPKDKLEDQAKAKEQDGQQQDDPAVKWYQTGRITISLSGEQRELMAQLHALLEASPDAEKPVTPTVIFWAIVEIAQDVLVKDGTIVLRERKSASQLLREGKAATVAEGSAETVSDGGSAGVPGGSAVGDHDDADEPQMTPPDWRPLQYKANCKGCGEDLKQGDVGLYKKGYGALGKACCEAKAQAFLQGALAA